MSHTPGVFNIWCLPLLFFPLLLPSLANAGCRQGPEPPVSSALLRPKSTLSRPRGHRWFLALFYWGKKCSGRQSFSSLLGSGESNTSGSLDSETTILQTVIISPLLSKTSQNNDLLLLGSAFSKSISHTDNKTHRKAQKCLERYAWVFRSPNLCCTGGKVTPWHFTPKFCDFLPCKQALIERITGVFPWVLWVEDT